LYARFRASTVAVAFAAVLLASCAVAPSHAPLPATFALDGPFEIDGRLSVRRGREALTANFSWRHAPPRDDLILSTPLGQTLAEISADASVLRYELRRSDGRHEEAVDWAALTEREFGAPLPVGALARWIVGAPRSNAPHSVEPDLLGRTAVLRQDGWEIVYAYADSDARLPARLQLSQEDVELRIIVLQRR
jgi:outer membrane lipoprotein LolB